VSTVDFQFTPAFDGENQIDANYIAVFKGFIHPLNSGPNRTAIKVYLVAAAAQAYLYLSTSDDPALKVNLSQPIYLYCVFNTVLLVVSLGPFEISSLVVCQSDRYWATVLSPRFSKRPRSHHFSKSQVRIQTLLRIIDLSPTFYLLLHLPPSLPQIR